MNIIKRDGRVVDFDKTKIANAVAKAFKEVYSNEEDSETIGKAISVMIENVAKKRDAPLSVEEIQGLVEEKLMATEYKDVAKAYVRYRYKREIARTYDVNFMEGLAKKISAENIENQNANVDERSFGGRTGEAANYFLKKYALDFCVSKMAKENHENNMIYIHDLSSYAVGCHNCLSIPFDDLLAKGFNTRQTDVRPAQSVSSAFQLLMVIFQLQSLQQFG